MLRFTLDLSGVKLVNTNSDKKIGSSFKSEMEKMINVLSLSPVPAEKIVTECIVLGDGEKVPLWIIEVTRVFKHKSFHSEGSQNVMAWKCIC